MDSAVTDSAVLDSAGYTTKGGNSARDPSGRANLGSSPGTQRDDASGSDLEQTRDPKALIPGDPQTLLATVKALHERDQTTFENAGKKLQSLDVGGWRGAAADGFHRASTMITNRWFRYAELIPKAAEAIDTYAHHLAWAQRQASVAIQRWAHADRLEADARQTHDSSERRDINQETINKSQSERSAARDILNNARRSLAEAETRLTTQLDALTHELPIKQALKDNAPGTGFHHTAKYIQTHSEAVPVIPASTASPTTPTSSNKPAEAPVTTPPHPSAPTPMPAPAPTPPVSITVSPPPTTPAAYHHQPTNSTPTPILNSPTSSPPSDVERHNPTPRGDGWYPLPHDPCPPADRPPAPTAHPTPHLPLQPAPQTHEQPPVPLEKPAPINPQPAHPPATEPTPVTPPHNPGPAAPGEHQPTTAKPHPPDNQTAPGPAVQHPPASPPEPNHSGNLATALAMAGGAVALVGGAAALAWMQSRKAYPIGSGQRDDYPPLEPVVREVHRGSPEHTAKAEPDTPKSPSGAESVGTQRQPTTQPPTLTPAALPQPSAPLSQQPPADTTPVPNPHTQPLTLDLIAAPGIGINGNGATEIIRALLIPLLAGDPQTMPGRVLLPARDCDWILGTSQPTEPTPRGLEIVPDLHHALHILETEIQHRTHHTEADNTPVVLVLTHPPADPATRDSLAELLHDGHHLAVTALILGDWPTGNTLRVAHDGTVTAAQGEGTEHLLGATLAGLSTDHALDLLTQLAHAEHNADAATSEDTRRTICSARQHDTTQPEPAVEKQHTAPNSPEDAEAADTQTPTAPSETATVPQPQIPITPKIAHSPEASGDPTEAVATARDPGSSSATAPTSPGQSPVLKLVMFGRVTLSWTPASTTGAPTTGSIVDLTRKQTELFAFLALHPSGVARDTLAETLWPDARPNRLTNGLHSTLNRLRRTLDRTTNGAIANPIITTADGTYKINPDLVQIDMTEFRNALALHPDSDPDQRLNAYERALTLYRSDLAEGIDTEWIMVHRENIRRDALDATAHLARALVNQGKQEPAIAVLDRARAIDPYNESVYQHIMRLQIDLGQPDAALRTLKLLTIKLREIDNEPTAETLRIVEARPSPSAQSEALPAARVKPVARRT